MKNKDLDLKNLKPALINFGKASGKYMGIMFFVLVALVYGFIILRINSLSNIQPSDSDVSAQSTKINTIPKVDPTVVQQLQSLKDNSVNVQALFEQARNTPFNE